MIGRGGGPRAEPPGNRDLKLVIVESPAKAKTIGRFLGKGYKVAASFGHIRDLPSSAEEIPEEAKGKPWSRMAVNVDANYEPIYIVPKESRKQIAELKALLKEADEVILATDEDREGESISWHLLEILKPKVPVGRIVFHEITQSAIQHALDNPRQVNMALVSAQESRRVLDRLYGYSLSPVLWKKVRPKLSAGRVQSVAVRIVVEREEERRAFKTSTYWDAEAALTAADTPFTATLNTIDGKRLASGKDFSPETGELKPDSSVLWLREADAKRIATALANAVPWTAARVDQKQAKLRPDVPFTTASLQRAASSIIGFSPKKTMQVAQKLYEGVDLGGQDREGLITYMRTDSITLSVEALNEADGVVAKLFGAEYHERRNFQTKSKMAQEAHEAIRPTKLGRTPEKVRSVLSDDEFKLYRLIWNRTLASQMADAQLLKTTVDFEAKVEGKMAVLRSNGSVVTFAGFLKVADSAQKDTTLPAIREGQRVVAKESAGAADIGLISVTPEGHETKPPARYTEASLIQKLEEEGIGRPSTYAPTISTIQQRGYVDLAGKTLIPTFLAVGTTNLLRDHFGEYVDYKFTAKMEDALDDIANEQQDRVEFLEGFYRGQSKSKASVDAPGKFGRGLEPHIEHEMPKIEFPSIPLGNDPETGEKIVVRLGKISPFIQRGEGGTENTATVPLDATYESLTAEVAAKLLREKSRGNEPLGTDPATGEKIFVLTGPYGPYVQLGERTDENPRPKRASLSPGMSPGDVTLDKALHLLSLPRDLGLHPETKQKVKAAIGRFGPYVQCDKDFRSLKGDDSPYTVSFERALELLAEPKAARRNAKTVLATLGTDPSTTTSVELCEGKYGPYLTNGEANVSTPKGVDPMTITFEQAVAMLADAPKKAGKRKSAARPKAAAKPKARAKAKAKPKAAAKAKAKPAARIAASK